jgi:hypothetical protein
MDLIGEPHQPIHGNAGMLGKCSKCRNCLLMTDIPAEDRDCQIRVLAQLLSEPSRISMADYLAESVGDPHGIAIGLPIAWHGVLQ